MEHEAADANEEISKICNGEDSVMTMLLAAFDACPGKIDEEQIGQSVDDLGTVVGGIIFLHCCQRTRVMLGRKNVLGTSSHQVNVAVTGSQ